MKFARDAKTVLRAALKLKARQIDLPSETYAKRVMAMERKLDKLLSKDRNFSNQANQKMAKSLARQRPHLLRFLYHQTASGTNNQAERDLRPAVLACKTGGCNKTHAVLDSVIETLNKKGLNPIDALQALITEERSSIELFSSA